MGLFKKSLVPDESQSMSMTDLARRLIPAKYRPYQVLSRLAWRSTQGYIAAGPFKGMSYISEAANSALVPKLLGTYEFELNPIVERLVNNRLTRLVDIGCAEGYYAVGFARRCPSLEVIAFDIDDRARRLATLLAKQNGVEGRLKIERACSPGTLQAALVGQHAAVICDIEGAEATLLDPTLAPGLRTAQILVEVHDGLVAYAGDTLRRRFDSTHRVATIAAVPRTREHCPQFHPLVALAPRKTVESLIIERPDEPRMYWLHLEPHEKV